MSILSLIKRAPKRISAVVAVIAVAIIIPASLHAWGPNRPTYTLANPADHITFDSITDNPEVGDERNFVGIRESGTTGTWLDNVTPVAGKQYTVRMYVHNNAATSLNLVAQNVTATINLPTNTAKSIDIAGFIDSSNASPTEVYDDAAFNSTQDFSLQYQAGSARYYNNAFGPTGIALPNSLFSSTGTLLGYDKLDGKIPGCFQYAGYITFTVTPKFSNYTTTKQVRKLGDTTWTNSVNVNPGDTVQYELSYKNTGETTQDNVTVKDTLPAGISYVPGTTMLKNGLYPNAKSVDDSLFKPSGLNIGSYAPDAAGYILFNAKVATNDSLPTCGPNTLVNHEYTIVGTDNKSATANVVVNKTCTNTPIYTCTALTTSLVSGTQYKFNGSASASNGASIVSYVFNFGDGSSQTVTNPSNVLHTYPTTNATYTPSLIVNVNVNGVNKTVTSAGCTTTITIGTPPVTPPQLPHTGPTDNIVAFLGLGAMIASIIYYVRSRRAIQA